MKRKRTLIIIISILMVLITAYFAFHYYESSNQKLTISGQEISDTTLDEMEELEENRPPLEVFVLDQAKMPKDRGVRGTTYTAQVYVVDNIEKQLYGPYKGSSYPNSRETPKGSDKPNSVNSQIHLFNNKYGHKGSTVKGLNIINDVNERITDGYSWSKKPTDVIYANVHSGVSDKGNYNSRGSLGCITIHPNQVNDFWKRFDFSIPRRHYETPQVFTKGVSKGTIFVSRTGEAERSELIAEIKEIYE